MGLRVNGGDGDWTFGEELREARERALLTQVEFAALLGVSPRTVQYWEAGKMPQPRHRRAIRDFLESVQARAA